MKNTTPICRLPECNNHVYKRYDNKWSKHCSKNAKVATTPK